MRLNGVFKSFDGAFPFVSMEWYFRKKLSTFPLCIKLSHSWRNTWTHSQQQQVIKISWAYISRICSDFLIWVAIWFYSLIAIDCYLITLWNRLRLVINSTKWNVRKIMSDIAPIRNTLLIVFQSVSKLTEKYKFSFLSWTLNNVSSHPRFPGSNRRQIWMAKVKYKVCTCYFGLYAVGSKDWSKTEKINCMAPLTLLLHPKENNPTRNKIFLSSPLN